MSFFPEVASPVKFEGLTTTNPFAYKYYDAGKVVGGKSMADHLRFAVCYWHTFCGNGSDPFGAPTLIRPWNNDEQKLDAAFEFFTKLGVPYWCFHDVDMASEGASLAESRGNLERLTKLAEQKQKDTGMKLLWGTANLFSHPRYQAGASTNPDPHVFAYALAQMKGAMDATHALGGEGYVFWGGREGYDTLLNTDMQREREQFAKFLWIAIDYAKEIGFKGQFYIEPKPKEPTTHQYDSNSAACLNFLREFGLMDHLKLNIETNHATLAGLTMRHELQVARAAGALGSIDANRGDELLGWDTDQFPTNLYLAAEVMTEVLAMGGFTTGGLNFDAKVRRQSIETADLFHAHVGAMDVFALGLLMALEAEKDGRLSSFVSERYKGWSSVDFTSIHDGEKYLTANGEPTPKSGRQEMLENIWNDVLIKTIRSL